MVERLVIQTLVPQPFSLASLTRVGTTATATTVAPHGFLVGDYVSVAGAASDGYNGKRKVLSVPTTRSFTFATTGGANETVAGTKTATYLSDGQGGRTVTWTTLPSVPLGVWAEMIPLKSSERLQIAAMQSDILFRFRTRRRDDVDLTMRALWRPRWPKAATQKVLQIVGVIPEDYAYMLIECAIQ